MKTENDFRDCHNIKAPSVLMYQKLILLRIYVAFSILFSTLAFTFEPLTRAGISNIATQTPDIWLWSAIALCSLAVLDIIINDLAPDKYSLELTYNYRHLIYMFLGVLSFSISIAVAKTYGGSFQLCRLWLDGGIAVVVAFLDILGRHRGFRDTEILIKSN